MIGTVLAFFTVLPEVVLRREGERGRCGEGDHFVSSFLELELIGKFFSSNLRGTEEAGKENEEQIKIK